MNTQTNTQRRRPLIWAHRGASAVAPQNSRPAFQKAIELGADGVELDVQYSSDGALVVFHDTTLDEVTSGSGKVVSHTLEELRQLDIGFSFSPEYVGERIMTLEEVFDVFGDRLTFNVELKVFTMGSNGMEQDVVELVNRFGLQDRVLISSFNPFPLRRIKRLAPRLRTGLLYAPEQPLIFRRAWFRHLIRPDALHPYSPMVDEAYMAWARRKGYQVNVWTVNEEEEMRRMIDLGVNAIITDHPDRLRDLLALG